MPGIGESLAFHPLKIAVLTVSDGRTLKSDTAGALLADRLIAARRHRADRAIVADDRGGRWWRTMAAKNVPGLYAIGEAVDVTGWLGRYDFQWAWASGWASGWAAGTAIGKGWGALSGAFAVTFRLAGAKSRRIENSQR